MTNSEWNPLHWEWHRILSPQEGFSHLLWGVFVIGLATWGFSSLRKWVNKHPPEWKTNKAQWLLAFLGKATAILIISYCVAQIIWQMSAHIAKNLSDSISAYQNESHFEAVTLGTGIADTGKDHLFYFNLQIYNSGSASIIKNWNLISKGQGGQPVQGFFITGQLASTNDWTMVNTDGSEMVVKSTELIAAKTQKNPIQRNSMEDGFVLFLMPKVNRDYLLIPGTTFELTFSDVYNKTYTNDYNWPSPQR